MRVALCISGQLRGFEKAYASVMKYIIEPLNPDVFIHTWENIGVSNNIHRRTLPSPIESYLTHNDKKDLTNFTATFPNYMNRLEQNKIITPEKLQEMYNPKKFVIETEPEIKDYDNFFNVSVPEKLQEKEPKSQWARQLFYKIYECNELKKSVEKEENFKYDLVIRLRPDLSIGGSIDLDFLNNSLYYRIRTIDPSYQISDQFFYGDSLTMDKTCDLFKNINTLWSDYSNNNSHHKYYWAEGLFYTYMKKSHPDINLYSYRTEASDKASKYQLLDNSIKFKYIEIKDELFKDILLIKDEKIRKKYIMALSLSLSMYSKSEEPKNILKLLEEFERLTQSKSNYTISLYHKKTSNPKEAINYAKKAIVDYPISDDIIQYLGIMLYEQKQYLEGKQYLLKSIELGDEFKRENISSKWKTYHILGYIEEQLENYETSYFYFITALSLKKNEASSFYRAGKMLFMLDRFKESIYYFKECLIINKKHDGAIYFLSLVYFKIKMFQNSSSLCREFIGNLESPKKEAIKMIPILAIVTFYRNQKKEAIDIFKLYLKYKTVPKEIIFDLLSTLIKLNEKQMIAEYSKIVIKKHPKMIKEIKKITKGHI